MVNWHSGQCAVCSIRTEALVSRISHFTLQFWSCFRHNRSSNIQEVSTLTPSPFGSHVLGVLASQTRIDHLNFINMSFPCSTLLSFITSLNRASENSVRVFLFKTGSFLLHLRGLLQSQPPFRCDILSHVCDRRQRSFRGSRNFEAI